MSTTIVGRYHEHRAETYLKRQGVCILNRNWRCRRFEIDLIGLHLNHLVFFEVKYRKPHSLVEPMETITTQKQSRILAAASAYLFEFSRKVEGVRFDLVSLKGNQIEWHQGVIGCV